MPRSGVLAVLPLVLLLVLPFAGASLAEDKARCDLAPSLGYCREYGSLGGWTLETARADCAASAPGLFTKSACPRANSVGECLFTVGEDPGKPVRIIYYSGAFSSESAAAVCPGTFAPRLSE